MASQSNKYSVGAGEHTTRLEKGHKKAWWIGVAVFARWIGVAVFARWMLNSQLALSAREREAILAAYNQTRGSTHSPLVPSTLVHSF